MSEDVHVTYRLKHTTRLTLLRVFQEKDETDSGYRSGTIPDEKLPPKPSDATLNREELRKRIAEFNKQVPGANFALVGKVTSYIHLYVRSMWSLKAIWYKICLIKRFLDASRGLSSDWSFHSIFEIKVILSIRRGLKHEFKWLYILNCFNF